VTTTIKACEMFFSSIKAPYLIIPNSCALDVREQAKLILPMFIVVDVRLAKR
jgi:hypothetical protein